MKTIKSLLERENFWYLFAILCLLNILSIYAIHQIIVSDPQYFTGGNAHSASFYRNIWIAINIGFPVICFIKVTIIAGLLQFGLKNWEIEVPFRELMSLVILGELFFWLRDLAQMVWFLFIHTEYTMKEVDNFSFLSLQFFIGSEASEAIKAIFQFFSIPEMLFWGILIYGLQLITRESLKRMAKLVLLTYGIASILYLILKGIYLYKFNG
ncbi:MAG: hypothetical protein HOO91_13810 [Bacteroidales bacterium]|nr:hypothetical protein [Bacteroidales bacterium]